jgi:hypothetical protein
VLVRRKLIEIPSENRTHCAGGPFWALSGRAIIGERRGGTFVESEKFSRAAGSRWKDMRGKKVSGSS